MLINHGMGFWNEFIGDNYVHRAQGRHGDRGTFDYYLLQIAQGMFPWTGVIAAASLAQLRRLVGDDGRTVTLRPLGPTSLQESGPAPATAVRPPDGRSGPGIRS